MIRNVVIVLISLIIVSWTVCVIRPIKPMSRWLKFLSFVAFGIWFFCIAYPNFSVVSSFFTPQISGKVIDADTKQPITGCNVKVYWQIEYTNLQGVSWEAYHRYYTATDLHGGYNIPRHLKVLGIYMPGFNCYYGGQTSVAYRHGYKYVINYRELKPSLTRVVELKRINNPIEYLENMINLDRSLSSKEINYSAEYKQYLIDEYRSLDSVFPSVKNYKVDNVNDKFNSLLLNLSGIFENLHEIDVAIDVLERLKVHAPTKAIYYEREIQYLKRMKK